jgi:hypothetical protein
MKNRILVSLGVALAILLPSCSSRSGDGVTNSWMTPDAGNYLVVYDQLGAKKGQVTYIGNGTVSFSKRDQDVYELSGRVRTVVYTSANQGEGGSEDQSVPISAQGVNGRADIEIKLKMLPTQESMGAYVKEYKQSFSDFTAGALRSAVQTCAISSSNDLSAFDFQKAFEVALNKCLTESFEKAGVRINFISAKLTGVPNFGESFAKSRAAIAEKKAAITALDLEKERRDKEAAIEKTIDDKTFARILAKKRLDIQEILAQKGINSFPVGLSSIAEQPAK